MQLGPGNLVQLVRAETELTHVASTEDEERLMRFGWSCNVIILSALSDVLAPAWREHLAQISPMDSPGG